MVLIFRCRVLYQVFILTSELYESLFVWKKKHCRKHRAHIACISSSNVIMYQVTHTKCVHDNTSLLNHVINSWSDYNRSRGWASDQRNLIPGRTYHSGAYYRHHLDIWANTLATLHINMGQSAFQNVCCVRDDLAVQWNAKKIQNDTKMTSNSSYLSALNSYPKTGK